MLHFTEDRGMKLHIEVSDNISQFFEDFQTQMEFIWEVSLEESCH